MKTISTRTCVAALTLAAGIAAPALAFACDDHQLSHDGTYSSAILPATTSTYQETTLGAATQYAYSVEPSIRYRPGTPCADRQAHAQAHQPVTASQSIDLGPVQSYQPAVANAPVVTSAPAYEQSYTQAYTQPQQYVQQYHHAPQVVERKVYVDRPVYVNRPVDRPVYITRRVPVDRPVYVNRNIPVPVDRPVYITKRIPVPVPQPVPVDRPVYMTKNVPVPVPTPVPVDRPVYVEKRVQVPVDRPYPVAVDRPVPVDRPVYVEKRVQVPVDRPYAVAVDRPVPVDRPVYVEKRVSVPVPQPYAVQVDRPVPVDRPVYVEKRIPFPVPKPVYVEKRVPVPVDRPVYVEKTVEKPVYVQRPVYPQQQFAYQPQQPQFNYGTTFTAPGYSGYEFGNGYPQGWGNSHWINPAAFSTFNGGHDVQRLARRVSRLSARIAENENQGKLTRRDARQLRKELQAISNKIDKARADGTIDQSEKATIRSLMNTLSANLKARGIYMQQQPQFPGYGYQPATFGPTYPAMGWPQQSGWPQQTYTMPQQQPAWQGQAWQGQQGWPQQQAWGGQGYAAPQAIAPATYGSIVPTATQIGATTVTPATYEDIGEAK